MKKKLIIILILLIATTTLFAKEDKTEISERLIRLEVKLDEVLKNMDTRFVAVNERFDSMQKQMDVRFDLVQKQIDFTNNLILTMLASLIGTVMYMWWDRRVANAPLVQSLEEEKKRVIKLETALKEYANSHPELREIFSRASIL